MSSCPSSSEGLPDETAKKFKEERYKYIKEDFKGIVKQAVFQYLANADFLPDLAFKVDRQGAIVEGLEELIKELKENT